jgi:hypothetical protein
LKRRVTFKLASTPVGDNRSLHPIGQKTRLNVEQVQYAAIKTRPAQTSP